MNKKANTITFKMFKGYGYTSSIAVLLTLFTLGISTLIRHYNLFYIPNQLTFGVYIPTYILCIILCIVTCSLFYFELFQYHTVPTILFISGGWSNVLEKLLFTSVTDYIPFSTGYINIADIMIWAGLIWLNISLWFFPKNWNHPHHITIHADTSREKDNK